MLCMNIKKQVKKKRNCWMMTMTLLMELKKRVRNLRTILMIDHNCWCKMWQCGVSKLPGCFFNGRTRS